MFTLIHIMLGIVYGAFYVGLILVALFFLLCMNVFTIPLFLLLWLFCKLFKFSTPKARLYGMMIYPSWSQTPRFTFVGTLGKLADKSKRKSEAKMRRSFHVTHAWEERFFY